MIDYVKKIIPSSIVRYRLNSSATKKIALTFDDGPVPILTEKVLEILKENDVQATFFVLGENVEKHPNIAQLIVNNGHEIASHGFTHTRCTNLTFKELQNELQKTDLVIKKITGVSPTLFRPPYGSLSLSLVKYMLTDRKYSVTMWSQLIKNEWNYNSKESLFEAFNSIVISEGDILLLHDVYSATVDALPIMLKTLKSKGISCSSINRLT